MKRPALKRPKVAALEFVNAQNEFGATKLHEATDALFKCEDVEEAAALLGAGADPNIQDMNGWTPLHGAVRLGTLEMVALLLGAGADPNIQNSDGDTALHIACFVGDIEVTAELLVVGANPNIRNKKGATPLFESASDKNSDATKLLLDAGADPNVADHQDYNPLFNAMRLGVVPTLDILLRSGANPNCCSWWGWRPLHCACERTENPPNWERVLKLLDAGADPCVATRSGTTPLHTTIRCRWNEQPEVITALLSNGADPNSVENATTPLQLASCSGHLETMKLLICAGANPNAVSTKGLTAMHMASREGHTGALKILLSAGARDVKDDAGQTAEMMAWNRVGVMFPVKYMQLGYHRRQVIEAEIASLKSSITGAKSKAVALLAAVYVPRAGASSPLHPLHMSFLTRGIIEFLVTSN